MSKSNASKFLSVSLERNNLSTLMQSKPFKNDMDTSLRSYKSTLSQHKKENDKIK
jgi:hypothetical protein